MIPMNNLIFGWNQIDYIQFSTLLQLAIFDTTFVFFCVWWKLWSHFNTYEIQHFPNSNSNGRPSYIRAKHSSNMLNNRKLFFVQFTFNLPTITDLVFKHIHFYSSIEPFCLLLFHKSEQNKCLPKNIAGAVGHWNTKLTTFLSVCLFTPCFSLSEKLTF